MNPPPPDFAHAAAFAFLAAAIVAAQLGDSSLATEMVAAAGMLEIAAAKLDQPPVGQRLIQLSINDTSVSSERIGISRGSAAIPGICRPGVMRPGSY